MRRTAALLTVTASGVGPVWAHHSAIHIVVEAVGESVGIGWPLWVLAAPVVVGLGRALVRWRRGR